VLSTTGEPIPNALIEIWQADEHGFYDVQQKEPSPVYGRGHLSSGAEGQYFFWSVKPSAYPIPEDGPVGDIAPDGKNMAVPFYVMHYDFVLDPTSDEG
jgi:hydroxyquinol 1,2-dioxygenase